MSSSVSADVQWRDNSGDCDGLASCRVGGAGQPGPWGLGLGLLLLGGLARRRRPR